ncbi:MAG: hypothetical protein WCS17_10700 [Prevotella sp.]
MNKKSGYPIDPIARKNRRKTILWIIIGVCCLAVIIGLAINYIIKVQDVKNLESSSSFFDTFHLLWQNY